MSLIILKRQKKISFVWIPGHKEQSGNIKIMNCPQWRLVDDIHWFRIYLKYTKTPVNVLNNFKGLTKLRVITFEPIVYNVSKYSIFILLILQPLYLQPLIVLQIYFTHSSCNTFHPRFFGLTLFPSFRWNSFARYVWQSIFCNFSHVTVPDNCSISLLELFFPSSRLTLEL